MDYLVPVERGTEWNRDRALSIPPGTRYTIAEHDAGEWAQAVTEGVRQSPSEFVFLSGPDVWTQREPDSLKFLEDLCWNADMTYGPLIHWDDGAPRWTQGQEHFCANRLYRENYIPGVACVRREAFLEAGGVTSGMWDLYVRMHEKGHTLKHVAEAASARDQTPRDLSPAPTPRDVVATFYYQATPGTAYWRCLLPARFLPGQAIFNYPVRTENEAGDVRLPQHEGAAVMQFTGDESHYLLTKFFRDQGIRVLIEVDDNYSRWFPEHMKRAGWKARVADTIQQVPHPDGQVVAMPVGYNVETHVATVKAADGVICTTPYLASQYRKHNENVFVCGNHIDPADWDEPVKPDDGKFRIGWFASGSHRADGELLVRALTWAGKQPDVEIVMVGVGSGGPGKPWWQTFPYMHYGWSNDMAVYRKFIQQLDVGLAPVVGTPWALGRSDLKALEYAMSAAVPFVSDVPCYEHTEMPHLQRCKTPKDWLRAIQWAVANQDEVREQAQKCREWTLANRTVEQNIGEWKLALAA